MILKLIIFRQRILKKTPDKYEIWGNYGSFLCFTDESRNHNALFIERVKCGLISKGIFTSDRTKVKIIQRLSIHLNDVQKPCSFAYLSFGVFTCRFLDFATSERPIAQRWLLTILRPVDSLPQCTVQWSLDGT